LDAEDAFAAECHGRVVLIVGGGEGLEPGPMADRFAGGGRQGAQDDGDDEGKEGDVEG